MGEVMIPGWKKYLAVVYDPSIETLTTAYVNPDGESRMQRKATPVFDVLLTVI